VENRNYLSGEIAMSQYETIDYVLANYMNVDIGYSEDDIISELKDELTDEDFKVTLESELKSSTEDDSFSWKNLFEKYNAGYFEQEEQAKKYAQRMIWNVVFET
jgi:hypothetical protein